MIEQEIQDLLAKYRTGTITDDERDLLYRKISAVRSTSQMKWSEEVLEDALEKTRPSVIKETSTKKVFKLKSIYYYAAASLLLLLGIYSGYYYQWKLSNVNTLVADNIMLSDKEAGTFKAYIKGENDQEYRALDSTSVQISSILQKNNNRDVMSWQSLHTPLGTEFKIVLEDGSTLWIGPGSTVEFPTRFAHTKREIFVKGEVLLEVTHQTNKPFVVHTDHQDIEVKGTLFNVKSVENSTTTTLINGVIWAKPKSNAQVMILKPGQSVVATADKQELTVVSIEEILGWRDGFFYFENTSLEDLLKKVALWYNVTIDRTNVDTSVKLSGRISKTKKLMEVARIFTLSTGIQFSLVKNTLILKKK